MKAELHFDLSDPGERASHMRCCKATNLVFALGEFRDWLRSLKHHDAPTIEIEKVRNAFNEALLDEGIDLDELSQ